MSANQNKPPFVITPNDPCDKCKITPFRDRHIALREALTCLIPSINREINACKRGGFKGFDLILDGHHFHGPTGDEIFWGDCIVHNWQLFDDVMDMLHAVYYYCKLKVVDPCQGDASQETVITITWK